MRVFFSLLVLAAAAAPAFAQGKAKAFDPGNLTKTCEWIDGLHAPLIAARSAKNSVAEQRARDSLMAEVAMMAGKNVDWILTVNSVKGTSVKFESVRLGNPTHPLSIVFTSSSLTSKDSITPKMYKPFDVPDKDWLATLKAGDQIRVQARVSGVGRGQSAAKASVMALYVSLVNCKFTKNVAK